MSYSNLINRPGAIALSLSSTAYGLSLNHENHLALLHHNRLASANRDGHTQSSRNAMVDLSEDEINDLQIANNGRILTKVSGHKTVSAKFSLSFCLLIGNASILDDSNVSD